jgi:hypothetical protein
MSVRLVDIGIPSFVRKTKRVLVPYTEEEIQELRRRINRREIAERRAFLPRFEIREDTKASLILYRKIIDKIPAMPGRLLILDKFGGSKTIITQINTEYDMREEFKGMMRTVNEIELDSFNYLRYLTNDRRIFEVQFLIGKKS